MVQRTEDGQDLVHKAGQRHLGAAIGLTEFIAAYLNGKLPPRLAAIAVTQPYAVYATFIFGLLHRWTFLLHTMPKASEHMQLLKDAIHSKLIPMLIEH